MFFYPHKAPYLFLPPLFAFRSKFEFSLKFTLIRLVKNQLFMPELLFGFQTYLKVTAQSYSTFYIIKIVKYNKMDFYLVFSSILRQFPPGKWLIVFIFSFWVMQRRRDSRRHPEHRLWCLICPCLYVSLIWYIFPLHLPRHQRPQHWHLFWSFPSLLTPNGSPQVYFRCRCRCRLR